MITVLKTIDAHSGGQAVRLIVNGLPRVTGQTMAQKRDSLRRRADAVRRALLLEPRGHANLRGVALTEPASPLAHAGLIFLDADGYPPLSGHALIAAVTIALERGLIGGSDELTLDTVAGTVRARAIVTRRGGQPHVESVTWTGLPAFVYAAGHGIRLGTRDVRVDVAFGGIFHAIVDTEAIGIPLMPARLPDLSRLAVDIAAALNRSAQIVHPADLGIAGIAAVTFTSVPQDPEAHLRSLSVSAGGRINRSPGGTGTMAVMAVLDAMGLMMDDQPFVNEGCMGTLLRGRVVRRTTAGELPAIVTEVEGSAWITGEHTFLLDEDDPCRDGLAG